MFLCSPCSMSNKGVPVLVMPVLGVPLLGTFVPRTFKPTTIQRQGGEGKGWRQADLCTGYTLTLFCIIHCSRWWRLWESEPVVQPRHGMIHRVKSPLVGKLQTPEARPPLTPNCLCQFVEGGAHWSAAICMLWDGGALPSHLVVKGCEGCGGGYCVGGILRRRGSEELGGAGWEVMDTKGV